MSNDKEIAFTTGDSRSELWVASTQGRFAPRKLSDHIRRIRSGPDGVWYSVQKDGNNAVYRLPTDGTLPQKVIEGVLLEAVSPDGMRLLVGRDVEDEQKETQIEAVKLAAPGTFVPICRQCWTRWSGDGRWVYVAFGQNVVGYARQEHRSTVAIPVDPKTGLPRIDQVLREESQALKLPGAKVVASQGVAISPDGSVIAFTRSSGNRNLFRVPFH